MSYVGDHERLYGHPYVYEEPGVCATCEADIAAVLLAEDDDADRRHCMKEETKQTDVRAYVLAKHRAYRPRQRTTEIADRMDFTGRWIRPTTRQEFFWLEIVKDR